MLDFERGQRTMSLVVVLPFCKKDTQAALRLLAWIKELGGCPEHDLVLLVAHGVADAAISTLKKESSFRTTDVMRTPFALPDESRHPIGPNWMFETAVKNLSTSFLWLEPDSVPLCSGWLNKLEAEYRIGISRNKSFM